MTGDTKASFHHSAFHFFQRMTSGASHTGDNQEPFPRWGGFLTTAVAITPTQLSQRRN